ncbi:hypothetical protein [Burkholderia ambifaria]|uniref:hypothetical protein n=1 Tax=Burkholderia ambifaria TaxID=152480 RepID=UPI001E64908E|nr:hypothetical protein [Burkholderia ambifaria]
MPSQFSTAATRRLIAPCVTPDTSAAARNEPWRATMQTVSRLASGGREPGAAVTADSASATRRGVRAEPSARRRTEL